MILNHLHQQPRRSSFLLPCFTNYTIFTMNDEFGAIGPGVLRLDTVHGCFLFSIIWTHTHKWEELAGVGEFYILSSLV